MDSSSTTVKPSLAPRGKKSNMWLGQNWVEYRVEWKMKAIFGYSDYQSFVSGTEKVDFSIDFFFRSVEFSVEKVMEEIELVPTWQKKNFQHGDEPYLKSNFWESLDYQDFDASIKYKIFQSDPDLKMCIFWFKPWWQKQRQ